MQVININTMDEIKNLVFEQEYNAGIDRLRSSYFYRGMPSAGFDLSTTLKRNCKDLASQLEMPLLENFIKYVSIEIPNIDESIWKAMIIGQHHGLPTRLLDWSQSALIALHFANNVSDLNDLGKNDCVVWRIDAKELNTKLPEKYKTALKEKKTFIFSVNLLSGITNSIEEYDRDMADQSLVVIEPPSLDQRIVNQYSFFTILPNGINDFDKYLENNTENTVKYIINRELQWDIRDTLDQLNINDRIMYPGIDGIAKWIGRHYFVKNKH